MIIPTRRHLPPTRPSITRKGQCGNYEFYVILGFYPDDNAFGEVFITVAKEGSTLSGMFDALASTISTALQHGIPWEVFQAKYLGMHFDPSGASLDGSTMYPSLVHAVAVEISAALQTHMNNWTDAPKTSPTPEVTGG